MSTLNRLQLEDYQPQPHRTNRGAKVISIASWKIRKASAHLLERFLRFGL